jgi:hypothetical protein
LTRTPLRVPQSALAQGRWLTTRASATDLIPAFGQGSHIVKGPFGVIPRMAFSIAAMGWPACGSAFNIATRRVPRGGGEEPCSTKS